MLSEADSRLWTMDRTPDKRKVRLCMTLAFDGGTLPGRVLKYTCIQSEGVCVGGGEGGRGGGGRKKDGLFSLYLFS